jgi:LPS O-antigen subunit length determinant protein (WzzB/FepE family)
MAEEGATGSRKDEVLREVLRDAWTNVQHHNAARLSLICLYFVFAAAGLAYLMLADGSYTQNLVVSIFVALMGMTAISMSVRYKERIVRDMRIVYKGMEMQLGAEPDLQQIWTIFKDYRGAKTKKSVALRLSSTRHLVLTIEVFSSALIALAVQPEVISGWFGAVVVGMFVLFVHEIAFMVTRRGLAFNV